MCINFFIFPVLVNDRKDALDELGADGVYDGHLPTGPSIRSGQTRVASKNKNQSSKRPVIFGEVFCF
ncbi:hypothetical protein R9C00_16420 [Flammeovirgaceae bacterium SG7u.111]|nr:hypothetical protein [Flammeovirgaceae bacterium SG7u.132]WPO33288.1 hypothetical protein R9C00_16420 [Flammeovirgaceae bacterium SG7u.111]